MSIFLVETYLAKQEKQAEFQKLLKEFLKFKKENPKVFEGLKSWKLLQQEYGGVGNLYVEMWEFEDLQKMEKINARIFKNKEMKRINSEFHSLIDQASFARFIWNTVA
jgi:predicted nucleotidyltransferase